MSTPLELSNHSQPWTQKLLQEKDWDDLWKLWWVCIKEMNRLHTFRAEKKRAGSMYGDYEADAREMAVSSARCLHSVRESMADKLRVTDQDDAREYQARVDAAVVYVGGCAASCDGG